MTMGSANDKMHGNFYSEVIPYAHEHREGDDGGERYVPGVGGEMEFEHTHRYLAVRELCRGKTVLDIASGEGYGAALIAQVAGHAVGVEIDREVVERARRRYRCENLEYRVGDAHRIPLDDASVDVAVSFETLEHIEGHDAFLRELRRVLRPGGVVVMSTPDKTVYAEVSGGTANPFHVSELEAEEFRELLVRYFDNVRCYGQRVAIASGIFALDREGGGGSRFFRVAEGEREVLSEPIPQKAVYHIAVASDGPLPRFPEGLFEGPLWINPLSSILGGVRERDQQILTLAEALKEARYRVDELQRSVVSRGIGGGGAGLEVSSRHAEFHDNCAVCGNREWREYQVLWPDLIAAWGLSEYEVDYVNRQQGRVCCGCGANLRSHVLASAIMDHVGYRGLLQDFVESDAARNLRLVEINEAGTLTRWLSRMPKHRLLCYPDVDLMALELEDRSVDLVVHSDSLEHVDDVCKALSECRRILVDGGAVCFTVPIIVGRLSRSREGLPASYHGDASSGEEDLKVRYEFGADFFEVVFRAGFGNCRMNVADYPAAIALTAVR